MATKAQIIFKNLWAQATNRGKIERKKKKQPSAYFISSDLVRSIINIKQCFWFIRLHQHSEPLSHAGMAQSKFNLISQSLNKVIWIVCSTKMNVLCSSVVLGGENEGEMNCDIPANTVGFSNVEFISAESLILVHVISHIYYHWAEPWGSFYSSQSVLFLDEFTKWRKKEEKGEEDSREKAERERERQLMIYITLLWWTLSIKLIQVKWGNN